LRLPSAESAPVIFDGDQYVSFHRDLLYQNQPNTSIAATTRSISSSTFSRPHASIKRSWYLFVFEHFHVGKKIVLCYTDLQMYYAVFRDNSFASDSTLVNFEQIFRTYSPTIERRVL
jgi:adenine-specific DNA-methyltransferase